MPDPAERTDFPTARRGYDRAAVDAHLAALRDEIRRLRESGSATATGEQVRSIVAAAEASAAEIREQAEERAAAIRAAARTDAERSRAHAVRAREAAAALLAQAEALEAGLGEALEALDAPSGEKGAGDSALRATAKEQEPPAKPEPAVERAKREPAAERAEPEPTAERAEPEPTAERAEPEPTAERAEPEPTPEEVEPEPAEQAQPAAANGDAGGDLAGARLIALQAALSGRPRAEADAELEGMLDPAARASLLDEVYAKAAAS